MEQQIQKQQIIQKKPLDQEWVEEILPTPAPVTTTSTTPVLPVVGGVIGVVVLAAILSKLYCCTSKK